MRPAIALKTLYRSPGKTIITFLLLAVLTFSLFLQVAEYRSTAKEFAENVEMYSGTGYVEKAPPVLVGKNMLQFPYYIATDPRVADVDTGLPNLMHFDYPALSAAEVEALSGLTGVSSVYSRYMTAGRSEYPRLQDDIQIWDNNSLIIVEGTYTGRCARLTGDGYYRYDSVNDRPIEMAGRLADVRLLVGDTDLEAMLAGGCEVWAAWQSICTISDPDRWGDFDFGTMEEGELYFHPLNLGPGEAPFLEDDWSPTAVKLDDGNMYSCNLVGGWSVGNVILKNYPYGGQAQEVWHEGDRYVLVLRITHQSSEWAEHFLLSADLYDWISQHFCPAVWNITDAPENYLDFPEYAPLRQLMEIIESDQNTQDVVYVDDMSAIRQIRDEKMVLTEGRWLTPEDTENGSMVCVLDQKFARKYSLNVGDTLSLELGDALFEQFYNQGAVAATIERFAANWTPAEFEIVGLYSGPSAFSAAKEPNWSYSINTVFVPLSALPETADLTDHEYAPGEVTFRVDDAWDIAPFLEKAVPEIEEMGLTLTFEDGGWMEVYTPYVTAQRAALVRIALLAVVTVMTTAFAVYLFISRKRKDYAIMRALGTPKGRSNASMLLPLLVLTAVSVAVGLAASTAYVAGAGTIRTPSGWLVLLCGGAELLLTLLLALLMLYGLSRKSPLALLQGEQTKTRRGAHRAPAPVGRDDPGTPPSDIPTGAPHPGEIETSYRTARQVVAPYTRGPLEGGRPRPLRFALRYIFRHIRRSAVKSLLSMLVAALMLAAAVQLGHMRIVYDRLKVDTIVTARFNNSIQLPKLTALEADGLTADLYYERNMDAMLVDGPAYYDVSIAITNDVAAYTGVPTEITYAPGYGDEDMSVVGKYVFVGAGLMEKYGIAPGDTLRFSRPEMILTYYQSGVNELMLQGPDMPKDYVSAYQLYPEFMQEKMDTYCDCLTVIGTVSTGNSTFDSLVYTAGMEPAKRFAIDTLLEYVEFRIPDNARAQEMKNLGEEMTGHRRGAFSIDIEKLESVERTAYLLETLYPIVVALALIIGAFLCALIILQTAKDAAIMRIQGTTAAMTRAILAVEQVLLAVIGVVIGVGVMAAIKGRDFPLIAARALTFGGAYIAVAAVASIVSAVLATKKNLLELLQTKE